MLFPIFPVLDPIELVASYSDALINLNSGEAREGNVISGNLSGLTGGEIVTYRWQEDTGGGFADISGETSASITIQIGVNVTDGATLRRVPTVDGTDVFSNTAPMRYDPVVAAGALADQSFEENTGVQTFATAGDFTLNSNTVAYSVNSISGVSINSGSGIVSFDTDTTPVQAGTSIIVTATDAYGRLETSGFSLEITVAPPVPVITLFTIDDNTGAASATVDIACTIYMRRDAVSTNPTAADCISGTGADETFSQALTAGSNTFTWTFDPGLDGIFQISAAARVEPDGEPSNVVTDNSVAINSTVAAGLSAGSSTDVLNSSLEGATFTSDLHTAQAGSNRLMVLSVTGSTINGASITSIAADFGTQAMTEAASFYNNNYFVAQFIVKEADIPTGAQTFDLTLTGGGVLRSCQMQVTEYTGADQTTSFVAGTPVTSFATGVSIPLTLTTATGRMLSVFGRKLQGGSPLPISVDLGTLLNSGKTGDLGASDHIFGHSDDLPGATGLRTHTYSTSDATASNSVGVALEILEA